LGVGVCECCGKEFELPVKLTVLSEEPQETYLACPFCFTKVEEARAEAVVESVLSEKREKASVKRKMEASGAHVGSCGHHLGYLKGRTKNAEIPDECLVCPKILQCMT